MPQFLPQKKNNIFHKLLIINILYRLCKKWHVSCRNFIETGETEMIIAVSQYMDRISPLFDTCRDILLVEKIGEKKVREIGRIQLQTDRTVEKIKSLEGHGTDVLICGALSEPLHQMLEMKGISVVPWTAGKVNDVVTAFVDNTLYRSSYKMPGCGRRQRRCSGKMPFRGRRKGGRQ